MTACISANVTPLLAEVNATATAISVMRASASLASAPMVAKASARAELQAIATAKPSPLQVTTALVCGVGDLHYIFVSPTDTQWISETDVAIYFVESDTKWRVE